MKIKKQSILDLALAITVKNISKGKEYISKQYVSNKQTRPKVKSKNHIIKTKNGTFYHVRGNMSGNAFKNLIDKNSEDIDIFLQSDTRVMKL